MQIWGKQERSGGDLLRCSERKSVRPRYHGSKISGGVFKKTSFKKKATTFVSNASQPKIAFFSLNMPRRNHIAIAKCLTLKETTCSKICSKSRPKSEKSSLPVGVRR